MIFNNHQIQTSACSEVEQAAVDLIHQDLYPKMQSILFKIEEVIKRG